MKRAAHLRSVDGAASRGAHSGVVSRLRLSILGAVQGVGFRPFVYRLAREMNLRGWVNNNSGGVTIEIEGDVSSLDGFVERLTLEKPRAANIYAIESAHLPPCRYADFSIRDSDGSGMKTAVVLPDLATCPDCLQEVLDPANRRYRYPFTNCVACGPRYSIIEGIPYDRPNTTMRGFVMCDACKAEYENPADRRFHAQPNACPICGPSLELWDKTGAVLAGRDDALQVAADAVRRGMIVAIKGIGGFQLIVDARNEEAARELRRRKLREEKPFAVMYPSLADVRTHCVISEIEESLLTGAQAPIVLLRRKVDALAPSISPGCAETGVMLAYTPLHHLLMRELGFPVIATSGNLSDEPICTAERDAVERLGGIADLLLVHNRPIARHIDDSVVRVAHGREMVLRRARGYAPLPLPLGIGGSDNGGWPAMLAYGAHQKCAPAINVGGSAVIGQHIGDLDTARAVDALGQAATDLPRLYDIQPDVAACDLHPDYCSSLMAQRSGLPVIRVQHHYAHVLSCMAENDLCGPVLGVSWDGTGLGDDATIWGGEFLLVDERGYRRAGHLRTFRLPGGERAAREPRRSALSLLYELYGDALFSRMDVPLLAQFTAEELRVLRSMLRSGVNCPLTSSAGRLFDAVAALVGACAAATFEGQAAMRLEQQAHLGDTDNAYAFSIEDRGNICLVDWEPAVRSIAGDMAEDRSIPDIARMFHNGLINAIVEVARRVQVRDIALTGGCFQSRYLIEHAVPKLRAAGFRPHWHQRVPPNDGGIALGQLAAGMRSIKDPLTTTGAAESRLV